MLRPLASFLLAAACAAPALADTRIRIEGTRRKSEAQVLELVGDRLEHIRGERRLNYKKTKSEIHRKNTHGS